MSVDREQIKRDAERRDRPNPVMFELPTADLIALLTELEQAESALREEMAWDMGGVPENEWMRRAREAEARLAKVPALVENLRWLRMALDWAVFRDDSRVWGSNEMRDIQQRLDAALAAWEQE